MDTDMTPLHDQQSHDSLRVALFVTCLADWMRPRVAEATVKVLEAFGCEVVVPEGQTCCAQPAYNSGDRTNAITVARHTLNTLMGYDYIVIPSGSCTSMIVTHYPELFRHHPEDLEKLESLKGKVFELCQFLVQVLKADDEALQPNWPESLRSPTETLEKITYHDSCSGLRELKIKTEPRSLIARAQKQRAEKGIEEALLPMKGDEDCCGFGGAFAAKYGEISSAIAGRKCEQIAKTNAKAVIMGDLGCMLNIEGKLRYEGKSTKVLHIAEYLAGKLE